MKISIIHLQNVFHTLHLISACGESNNNHRPSQAPHTPNPKCSLQNQIQPPPSNLSIRKNKSKTSIHNSLSTSHIDNAKPLHKIKSWLLSHLPQCPPYIVAHNSHISGASQCFEPQLLSSINNKRRRRGGGGGVAPPFSYIMSNVFFQN